MSLIALIISVLAGLVVGWVSGVVAKDSGHRIVINIIIGIFGAFLLVWVLGVLGLGPLLSEFEYTRTLVISLIGAIISVAIAKVFSRGQKQPTPSFDQRHANQRVPERDSAINAKTRPKLGAPFSDVERRVASLRQQVADGLLTEADAKARMRELMVEDADGNWWMVGYKTGDWYRHDGTDWVRADPPVSG